MSETKVGKITHFFGKIGVGVVALSGELKVGDKIKVKGGDRDFEQEVASMQVDRVSIEIAKKGSEVGMKFDEAVKEGDVVYKMSE